MSRTVHVDPLSRDGGRASLERMMTAGQSMRLCERVWSLIRERHLFVLDFWNGATGSNGCVAAGRPGGYFHVNWNDPAWHEGLKQFDREFQALADPVWERVYLRSPGVPPGPMRRYRGNLAPPGRRTRSRLYQSRKTRSVAADPARRNPRLVPSLATAD